MADRTYATLDEWVTREAVPFALDAPRALNSALDGLLAAQGDAVELLGFGEALHGGEEILLLRNRLFQRLVEAHGFRAIAVESSLPRGRLVNEYVAGRGPASYEQLQDAGFSHGFGRLEANRELVAWMRAYNADHAHQPPLRFYGWDSPTEMMFSDSPRQALHLALEALASLDPVAAQTHRERIDALLGPDAAWENPAAMMDPAQSVGGSPAATALRGATEDLIVELHLRRPEWMALGAELVDEAELYAVTARCLLSYHAEVARASGDRTARLLGLRDAWMADNLARIVTRERGRGRVLAFAHNSHLKRGKALWQWGPDALSWWPAGAHLAAMLGARYAVIGTGVGVSPGNGIGQPEAGTLEALLTSAPGPARWVPTHLGAGLPASAVAALPTRSGSARNLTYFALTPASLTDFNALAVVDTVTYTRGGPPLP